MTQLLLTLAFETLGGHDKDTATFLSRLSTAVATRHDAGRTYVNTLIASTISRAVADRLAASVPESTITEPFVVAQEVNPVAPATVEPSVPEVSSVLEPTPEAPLLSPTRCMSSPFSRSVSPNTSRVFHTPVSPASDPSPCHHVIAPAVDAVRNSSRAHGIELLACA